MSTVSGHARHLLETIGADALRWGPDDPNVRDVVTGLQAAATVARGTARSASEERAYISSHPHLSLVQALLEESAHTGRFATVDGAQRPARAEETGQPGRLRRWSLRRAERSAEPQEDFDKYDIRWIEVAEQLVDCWRRRIHFAPPARPVTTALASHTRLILLSDWGNGSDVAVEVAKHAREWLAGAGDRECHVIHLGDVYYAGTEWEAANRFLAYWPVRPDEAGRYSSWCLNGNHDMYAAGKGLFDVILKDPRFAGQVVAPPDSGPTSRFLLRGADWQVIGLDSSWKFDWLDIGGLQGRLGAEQGSWFADRVGEFDGRTIALTHHQPVSRSRSYPAPLTLEQSLLDDTAAARSHGLAAWFWGHEHRCVTFEQLPATLGVEYAACVGHGAMPQEPTAIAPGPAEWELTAEQPPDADGDVWRTCGFAVIDLDPGVAQVHYIDQSGQECKTPHPDRLPGAPEPGPLPLVTP